MIGVAAVTTRARHTAVVLALPVLALTCWVQVLLIQPPSAFARPPAVAPLLAQFTGWCALTVAAATCTDRSRYADLGGAVAAPVSLALIGLALFGPRINHVLATPPASRHTATVAWYAIAAVAVLVAGAAMHDRWHRYTRPVRQRAGRL